MTGYSTHWRATIFAALILHFAAALIFSYVLPSFASEMPTADVTEIEWVDVDLSEEVVVEEEPIPPEPSKETLPTFDVKDLFVPELNIPEPVIEQPVTEPPKTQLPPMPEIKPFERPQPTKPPQAETQPAQIQPEVQPVKPAEDKQVLTRPPITVMEVYPKKGGELGYRGYVSIAARIGKDGKVKSTEIIQSSGRYFVDEIALKAARQWAFKPALDQIGRPMECDKIITFNFKKLDD